MALDGLTLTAVINELKPLLISGRIDRVFQPLNEEVHLIGRTGAIHWRLLLSAHPANARLHLTKESKPNPPHPPLFCMVLRKHLENGRIRSIEQEPWERIIRFQVESNDELGGLSEKSLFLEIMGKHSNIILVEQTSGLILDGIRRYTHAVSRHREVLPGRKYISPPSQNKLLLSHVNDESLAEVLYQTPERTPVENALQKNLAGLSPETAREICFRAGLTDDAIISECGGYELGRIVLALRDLLSLVASRRCQPEIVLDGGKPVAFAPWPLSHLDPQLMREKATTINDALDHYYHSKGRLEKVMALRQSLLKRTASEWERVHRKKLGQEKDIESAKADLRFRTWGEVLLTNLYRVKPGDQQLVAEDLNNPAEKHHIELDPSLSPAENAQLFFSKYNKARQTVTQATQQLDNTALELIYIESVLIALEQGETLDDLTEIRQELIQSGYLQGSIEPSKKFKTGKAGAKKSKSVKAANPPPKPSVVTTTDGWTIWIGRNNRQNDYLTMKMARDHDIWLHTKDIPGAHVVIPVRDRKSPPKAVLEEAAAYAAYYSQARDAAKVPVDYTERRYVRKPAGAKPGFVIYDHQQTLWVNPMKIQNGLLGEQ